MTMTVRCSQRTNISCIAKFCDESRLDMLNGIHVQTLTSLNRLTSFHTHGNALVDYALASSSAVNAGRIHNFHVHRHIPVLSDYAALSVLWTLAQDIVHGRGSSATASNGLPTTVTSAPLRGDGAKKVYPSTGGQR